MIRKHIVSLVVVLLAVAGAILYVFLMFADQDSTERQSEESELGVSGVSRDDGLAKSKKSARKNRVRTRKSAIGTVRPQLAMDSTHEATDVSEFSPAEQKTVDAIQDALDDEDLTKAAAQVKVAAASTNVAVRAKAVEALQWFGVKALPELAMFMADEDDDVRTSAIDAWTMGLSQMEAGDDKASTVQMGLSVVTDRDQLESMVMQVDDLSDFQKLDVLTQIIEGKNKIAAEVAREHYKFWTDEEYTDLETAQKWLDAQAQAEE